MRASAGNFNEEQLREAVQLAHSMGRRVYVTCNTLPREDELAALPKYLEFLQDVEADALIIADIGVLELAKRYAPKVAKHISTQFGVINSAAANALYALGADTGRPRAGDSAGGYQENSPQYPAELRLEAFVHGAMCVSFSGRCLLSNYCPDVTANRGQCASPPAEVSSGSRKSARASTSR